MLAPWKERYGKPRQHIKKRRHHFANKGLCSPGYDFSGSHVWMWELDCKESWVLKNWCFWTVVLKKTLESPLDCKEIKPVNPKGSQPWIGAVAPILWPLDMKSWLIERPWCWEWFRAGGEGGNKGWDCWTASLTQWTWVWANFGIWWWIGKQVIELQWIGLDSTKQQHHLIC